MEDYYKNKRVLVTGADGFIGSHLALRLVELGARVYAVLGPRNNSWRLTGATDSLAMLSGNLNDPTQVAAILDKSRPFLIFNAASSLNTKRDFSEASNIIEQSYGIARNVLSLAGERGVARAVQFGSIEEYGLGTVPFIESQREDPISPYSLGKIMSTQYAKFLSRYSPMEVCVVRPAATFGPAQGFTTLIPIVIRSAMENKDFNMNPGKQMRDFIYVSDLVEGVLLCGMHKDAGGEIFNLGSNRGILVKEVVETVIRASGNTIRVNFGAETYRSFDNMLFYMSSEKAKKILGWEPKTELISAIRQTVSWYQNNYEKMPK